MERTKLTRPRVLFYAPILEYPPAGGPQLSVVNAVKALHEVSDLHIVTIVAPDHIGGADALQFFRNHSRALVFAPTSRWNAGSRFLDRVLGKLRRMAAPLFARIDVPFLLRYAEAEGIDVVWVDRVLEYGFAVFSLLRRLRPDALLVGDTCSVYSRFILRELPLVRNPLRRWWIGVKGHRKQRQEHLLTASADVVTAVSQLDAEYFRSIAPDPSRVKLFSNIVDLRDYQVTRDAPGDGQPPHMLLLGSFGHPNSPMDRAARWMAQDVMPRVLRAVPDARLIVVGRNAERTQAESRSDSITVVGQVPSVLPYLRSAVATLVPLRFESGTRFKILESGAASVPCISTTLGAEGIEVAHGSNILIADDTESFAAAMVRLFRDPPYARQLGDALHTLVAARYSLGTQTREGRAIIDFLLERRRVRES